MQIWYYLFIAEKNNLLVFRQRIELLYKYNIVHKTHRFHPACSVRCVHVLILLYSQKR